MFALALPPLPQPRRSTLHLPAPWQARKVEPSSLNSPPMQAETRGKQNNLKHAKDHNTLKPSNCQASSDIASFVARGMSSSAVFAESFAGLASARSMPSIVVLQTSVQGIRWCMSLSIAFACGVEVFRFHFPQVQLACLRKAVAVASFGTLRIAEQLAVICQKHQGVCDGSQEAKELWRVLGPAGLPFRHALQLVRNCGYEI